MFSTVGKSILSIILQQNNLMKCFNSREIGLRFQEKDYDEIQLNVTVYWEKLFLKRYRKPCFLSLIPISYSQKGHDPKIWT